jgi:hypothetical protein
MSAGAGAADIPSTARWATRLAQTTRPPLTPGVERTNGEEVNHMHPPLNYQVAVARHRELLAQAEQQRQVRQAKAQARELRRADRPERTFRRAARLALRLRAALED